MLQHYCVVDGRRCHLEDVNTTAVIEELPMPEESSSRPETVGSRSGGVRLRLEELRSSYMSTGRRLWQQDGASYLPHTKQRGR